MGYAAYVGRVGALAVALGIATAVANTPGMAWAEPGSSPSSSGSSDPGAKNPDAGSRRRVRRRPGVAWGRRVRVRVRSRGHRRDRPMPVGPVRVGRPRSRGARRGPRVVTIGMPMTRVPRPKPRRRRPLIPPSRGSSACLRRIRSWVGLTRPRRLVAVWPSRMSRIQESSLPERKRKRHSRPRHRLSPSPRFRLNRSLRCPLNRSLRCPLNRSPRRWCRRRGPWCRLRRRPVGVPLGTGVVPPAVRPGSSAGRLRRGAMLVLAARHRIRTATRLTQRRC